MQTQAQPQPTGQAFLAAAPAGPWDRRLATAFILLSFAILLAVAPFGHVHLPAVPPFVPAYESALWVCDLATALLLLGHFHRARLPSLLVLSSGYLMSTLIIPPHLMTFPGLFAPNGLLGGLPTTISWLYVFWHTAFPLFVLAHTLVARAEKRRGWTLARPGMAMLAAAGATALFVLAACLTAIHGVGYLPIISVNGQYGRMLTSGVSPIMICASAAALAAIWLNRRGSTLDVWLMVVMSAWLCDVALSAVVSITRFDLGWYMGRIYALAAGAFLLGVLLLDLSRLYGRLADAVDAARAQNLALIRSREELTRAQRMEAVGQLTGGIAHDFNNILTAVIGCLEMIARRPDDPERVGRLARNAATAADRGAQLVRQLLTFSRRQNLKPQPLSPNDLLLETATLAREALGEGVALALDLAEDIDRVCVDAGELQAAILNLVSNARDAMPGGGVVTLRTRNVPGATSGDDVVLVSVADTGHGMDAGTLARVFEPFFTTKDIGRGTGLGLSQVYGFAESAGGSVQIQSEQGEGSVVTLRLPRTLLPLPAPEAPTAPDEPAAMPTRVLVVEDDADVIGAVVETLRDAGFEVVTASTGAAALAALKADPRIQVLFSDVMMPGGVDGMRLAEAGLQARPGLKVLLTSGYSHAALQDKDMGRGLPILTKPYHREDLLRSLNAVIRA
jgi:signal transduction histidine kinase/CheY-like chemotaxis protein